MQLHIRMPYSSKNNTSFQDLLLPTRKCQDVKEEQRQFGVNAEMLRIKKNIGLNNILLVRRTTHINQLKI